MDEQGFDFRHPQKRREPKRFEPPPWEKQAFEELERKREEERREEEARKAAEEEPEILVAQPVEPETERPGEEPDVTEPEPVGAGEDEAAGEPKAKGIEEREMIEMLAALAAEEPKPSQEYPQVAIAIGVGIALLGAVLVIWAMAALVGASRTGAVGYVGGAALGFFGVFFMAMGVWMVYRALKQRGVL